MLTSKQRAEFRAQANTLETTLMVGKDGVTAIAITKLDGTAKGGIVIAVSDALKVPVKFVGVGEQADDLMPFVAKDFVDALIQ